MDLLYLLLITHPRTKARRSWAILWWRLEAALWSLASWLLQVSWQSGYCTSEQDLRPDCPVAILPRLKLTSAKQTQWHTMPRL